MICNFQAFEQEKSIKTEMLFMLVFMLNSKHVHFYWESLYSLYPSQWISLEGFNLPDPLGIDPPAKEAIVPKDGPYLGEEFFKF